MSIKKIKVKDYYAVQRGKKRLEKIPIEKRKEIGRKGAKAKWSKKSCDGMNTKSIKVFGTKCNDDATECNCIDVTDEVKEIIPTLEGETKDIIGSIEY